MYVKRQWLLDKKRSPLLRRLLMVAILFPPMIALTNYEGHSKKISKVEVTKKVEDAKAIEKSQEKKKLKTSP